MPACQPPSVRSINKCQNESLWRAGMYALRDPRRCLCSEAPPTNGPPAASPPLTLRQRPCRTGQRGWTLRRPRAAETQAATSRPPSDRWFRYKKQCRRLLCAFPGTTVPLMYPERVSKSATATTDGLCIVPEASAIASYDQEPPMGLPAGRTWDMLLDWSLFRFERGRRKGSANASR